ncbi:M15 family metallopeptidase [Catellatospora sp. KI3]|uniref:M15 family metallopeptidase n=1 Tax=Catellatospora sp. KI3 TaxID=3041620 RepID=UPI0024825538|nr:M15 family metallopeptidase [Catellatospora sp. KI3]MDI1462897.1 M15 family metallopeptidase [Catellatospora sp. KI3]
MTSECLVDVDSWHIDVPVAECGEPLVDLAGSEVLQVGPDRAVRVRLAVADRLVVAQSLLPRGVRLLVVAGHRTDGTPHGPHATGGEVDVTLCGADGTPLWLGTQVPDVGGPSRLADEVADDGAGAHRALLGRAMTAAGMVNHPAAWWHWSYGEHLWALATRAAARYARVAGPS